VIRAIQVLETLGGIAEADTRRAFGLGRAETGAIVAHLNHDSIVACPNRQTQPAAPVNGRHAMTHGVLEQRLQQEARHKRIESARLEGDFGLQPIAEPGALDLQVPLDDAHFVAQGNELRALAKNVAEQVGEREQHPQRRLHTLGTEAAQLGHDVIQLSDPLAVAMVALSLSPFHSALILRPASRLVSVPSSLNVNGFAFSPPTCAVNSLADSKMMTAGFKPFRLDAGAARADRQVDQSMFDLARTAAPDWFSIDDVAEAAGVGADEAWRLVALGQAVVHSNGQLVSATDAVHLVRVLRGESELARERVPFNQIPAPARKITRGLAAAGVCHTLAAILLILSPWLAFLDPARTDEIIKPNAPEVRMVYLMMPGPGGGGGGGGLLEKRPPPPARKKAETRLPKLASRVPPMRPRPAPPARPAPPRPLARVEPSPVEKPPAPVPPAVQAPVKTIAADPLETFGVPLDGPPAPPSRGPGSLGGVGAGSGQGLGDGTGGGIGPGSGGGTGGGPYQPGSGIDPPTLVKEIRPGYTDAARRAAIEGDVVLEIVVRQDGSVGHVRVRRTLGAGLEAKAIEAVRQWRFIPAKRRGTPVDVVVDVSVEFKLR
jgi:protein TonB